MPLKTVLTIAGALAEFGALFLVVRDFYEARAMADAILGVPPQRVAREWAIRYDIRPEDMAPEERERQAALDFKAALVAAISPAHLEHVQAGESSEAHLRATLAGAFRGSTVRKWLTIALLATGIVLSASANLL